MNITVPDTANWVQIVGGACAFGATVFSISSHLTKSFFKRLMLEHTVEIKKLIEPTETQVAKISYALFNDGRGIEQQMKETNGDVKEIAKNQSDIKLDIAVLKTDVEALKAR